MRTKWTILHRLRGKDGSVTIQTAFGVIVLFCVLIVIITVFSLITRIQTQNTIAHELARYIEVRGEVTSETDSEFSRLLAASTLKEATYTIDADYLHGSNKLAFNQAFEVYVTSTSNANMGGVFALPVTITGKATGRSEVYWKS